jgi:hypothetical protein
MKWYVEGVSVTTPNPVPWLSQMMRERDTVVAQAKIDAAEKFEAESTLRSSAPVYMKALYQELQTVADNLPQYGVAGVFSMDNIPPNQEHCHLYISPTEPVLRSTYVDLYWTVGSATIRCHTFEGTAYQLHFRIYDGELYLTNDWISLLDAKEAAKCIAKPMVEKMGLALR